MLDDDDMNLSEDTRRFTRRYKTFTAKLPLSDLEQTEQNLKDLTPRPDSKYIHEGVIAYGGMKLISRLRDRDTLRDVAHATLLNHDADIVTIGRFLREARITANLEHPNIMPIHDIGIEGNIPYFTMKLIDGDTLQDIIGSLKEGDIDYVQRFPLTALLRIFRRVLDAIAFAHTKGVIHLDLSPGNILVGKFGEVLVLDWGISRVLTESGPLSADENDVRRRLEATPNAQMADGIAQGTPGYMAPEQASGHNSKQDVRTDIYALGAILYAILTYRSAIPGKTMQEVLANTVEGHFKPPRHRVKHYVPSSLNAVVMKAMSTERRDRYQTVSELRADIDAFIDGRATLAEKPTILKHTFLFFRRNWIPVSLSFMLIFLLGGYGIYQVLNDYVGVWHWGTPVYSMDYRTEIQAGLKSLTCTDSMNNPLETPFVFTAKGVAIPANGTIWLSEPRPYMDARAIFKLRAEKLDFDIFWGCSNVPVDSPLYSPPGTLIRIRDNTVSLSNNRYTGIPIPFVTQSFSLWNTSEGDYTLTIQSINGVLSVYINNLAILRNNDPYPVPVGKAALGIRAGTAPMTLSAAEIFPASPDADLGPFAIPEMLIWRGAAEEAVTHYISVARQTASEKVARQACVRAMCLILYRMNEFADPSAALDHLRDSFPDRLIPLLEDRYYAIKAEIKWRIGLFSESFRLMRLIADPVVRLNTARHLEGYRFTLPPEAEAVLDTFLSAQEQVL